jgi:hypothetical protein
MLLDNVFSFLYSSVYGCVAFKTSKKEDSKMVSNELGQQLHGRAVRGEALSAEERAQLEAWYAEMDRAEAARLNSNATAKTIESLQAEIDSAVAQLADTIKRIQEISAENAVLRRENDALLRQLAQRSMLQPV